jgi:hypothetical protein
MPIFIDFEAFKHGDEDFIIKELCILDTEQPLSPLYFLFKPTVTWDCLSRDQQRTYAYLEHNIHRLAWSEGHARYCRHCVFHYIEEAFPNVHNTTCYILGHQKVTFLRREFPELNITEYTDVNSFKDLPRAPSHLNCIYRHHSREHCAVIKSYQLYTHYRKYNLF